MAALSLTSFPAPGALFLVALLVACSKDASEGEQFQLWAKHVSQQAREARGARRLASGAREVERLQRRLGISEEELLRISRRAEAEKWAESERCRPASNAYYQNGLLLTPQPLEPLVGRPTPKACRDRLEGVSIVGAVVDAEGIVREPAILKGLDAELDDRALATVRGSRWYPAMLCGRPVAVHYTMAVPFRLGDCEQREDRSGVPPVSRGTDSGPGGDRDAARVRTTEPDR